MRLFVVLSVVCALVSGCGNEELKSPKWSEVDFSTKAESRIYVDTNSIEKTSLNEREFWFKSIEKGALKGEFSISKFLINCSEKTYRELQYTEYYEGGSTSKDTGDTQAVIPGSRGAEVFNFVCSS
jgi:hypothetical protein